MQERRGGLQCIGDHQAEPVLVDHGDAVHEVAVAHGAGRGIPLHLPPAVTVNCLVQGAVSALWAAVGDQGCLPDCASCKADAVHFNLYHIDFPGHTEQD